MRTRAPWILFLLLGAALLLPACGGGGSAAEAGVPDTPTEDPPPPPTEPPAPPTPSVLDQQLAPLLVQAGVATPAVPPDQPAALVALGEALFFDKLLSGNRDISCATCHHPTAGTGDDLSVSIGTGGSGTGAARQLAGGHLIPRNAPPLFNRGLPEVRRMFWDSRLARNVGQRPGLITPEPALNGPNPQAAEIVAQLDSALAAQALFPLTSREEMRGQPGENDLADAATNLELWELVMARLVGTNNGTEGGIAGYRALFQDAFPQVVDFDELHIGHVGRALGAYQDQTYRALASPFDAYLAGDLDAIDDQAKRGAILFYSRADCHRCHDGPLMTDDRHHAIAVPQIGPGKDAPFEDTGRFGVTGDPNDRYRFRTPSLRNVELTGPWMHDGAYTTLQAAVAHYDNPAGSLRGYDVTQLTQLLRPTLDVDPTRNQARIDALSGILRPSPNLSPVDVADITAFLRTLTDPSSRDMAGLVPASVPSGLPVAD